MALGKGIYDDLCTYVREKSGGEGAVVIIFGGKNGSGFSAQADMGVQMGIPDMLELLAKEIRNDLGYFEKE
jgi:hypothetical protein